MQQVIQSSGFPKHGIQKEFPSEYNRLEQVMWNCFCKGMRLFCTITKQTDAWMMVMRAPSNTVYRRVSMSE